MRLHLSFGENIEDKEKEEIQKDLEALIKEIHPKKTQLKVEKGQQNSIWLTPTNQKEVHYLINPKQTTFSKTHNDQEYETYHKEHGTFHTYGLVKKL